MGGHGMDFLAPSARGLAIGSVAKEECVASGDRFYNGFCNETLWPLFAVGDDWTDEDLFRALPPEAYSVRVGLAATAARYHLANHTRSKAVDCTK